MNSYHDANEDPEKNIAESNSTGDSPDISLSIIYVNEEFALKLYYLFMRLGFLAHTRIQKFI